MSNTIKATEKKNHIKFYSSEITQGIKHHTFCIILKDRLLQGEYDQRKAQEILKIMSFKESLKEEGLCSYRRKGQGDIGRVHLSMW